MDDAGEQERGPVARVRDHVAVAAVLAVLLITGPLGDHQLVGSWTGAALTVGVAAAVAAVVRLLLRPRS